MRIRNCGFRRASFCAAGSRLGSERRRKRCAPVGHLIVAAALALAPRAHGSELIPRSLPELAQGAQLVFIGRCEAVSTHWNQDHDLIYTANRFRVLRTLKGEPGSTITLEELGGTVGDERLEVADVPRFSVGEEALLCVHRTELGRWSVFGAGQGRFEIVRDARGRPWVQSEFYRHELGAMGQGASGNGRAPLAVFAGHMQALATAREMRR